MIDLALLLVLSCTTDSTTSYGIWICELGRPQNTALAKNISWSGRFDARSNEDYLTAPQATYLPAFAVDSWALYE